MVENNVAGISVVEMPGRALLNIPLILVTDEGTVMELNNVAGIVVKLLFPEVNSENILDRFVAFDVLMLENRSAGTGPDRLAFSNVAKNIDEKFVQFDVSKLLKIPCGSCVPLANPHW